MHSAYHLPLDLEEVDLAPLLAVLTVAVRLLLLSASPDALSLGFQFENISVAAAMKDPTGSAAAESSLALADIISVADHAPDALASALAA